jgi:hypothetical protein
MWLRWDLRGVSLPALVGACGGNTPLAVLAAIISMFIGASALAQQSNRDVYLAVVQQICRQYAAAQHGLPYDIMYAQCMYARGYRVPGFSPSPASPGYQGELPGPAAHNGGP